MRNVLVRTERHYPDHWSATLDGWEPGDPMGRGSSEAEAVYDLFMEIEDREADDQERYEHEMGQRP